MAFVNYSSGQATMQRQGIRGARSAFPCSANASCVCRLFSISALGETLDGRLLSMSEHRFLVAYTHDDIKPDY